MFNLGPMEVAVIVLVALVVLGPQRLPDAMRQAGKAMGDLRRWSGQMSTQVHSVFDAGAEPETVAQPVAQQMAEPVPQPMAEPVAQRSP